MEIESVPTGVEVIDTAVPGGIPRNCMVILHGEGGTGKSVFLANMAYKKLQAGEPVLYLCLDDDPRSLLQIFSSFRWAVDEYVRKGAFKAIDCFTFRVKSGGLTQLPYVFRIVNFQESYDLIEALIAAMNEMQMQGRGAIFIDSLNELLSQTEITTALETVKTIRALAPKMRNVPVFATLHTGIESMQEILFTLSYSVDGIIEFRYDPSLQQLGMPIMQLYVRKLRGSQHAAAPLPYAITAEGIRPVDSRKLSDWMRSLQPTRPTPGHDQKSPP